MPIVVKAVPFDKYCAWWNRDAVQDISASGSDSTSQTSPLGGIEYSTKKKITLQMLLNTRNRNRK
jgi:hypothetical protein